MDAKLGGTPERPIELMIVSLDTPDYMTSVCSAGAHMCACDCVRVVEWEGDKMGGKVVGLEGRSALGMCVSVGGFLDEIACEVQYYCHS